MQELINRLRFYCNSRITIKQKSKNSKNVINNKIRYKIDKQLFFFLFSQYRQKITRKRFKLLRINQFSMSNDFKQETE